jgi:hypothetical protein
VSESDSALVPPYYAKFLQGEKIDLWLKTGPFKQLPSKSLNDFEIHFTGTPLVRILMKSRGSVLFVSRRSLFDVGLFDL